MRSKLDGPELLFRNDFFRRPDLETESGVDHRVFDVVTAISALVSIASRLVFVIFNLMGAGVACIVFTTSQPTVLAHTKAGH